MCTLADRTCTGDQKIVIKRFDDSPLNTNTDVSTNTYQNDELMLIFVHPVDLEIMVAQFLNCVLESADDFRDKSDNIRSYKQVAQLAKEPANSDAQYGDGVVVKVRHTGVRFDGAGAYYLPTESTTQCQWEGGRRGPIVIGKGRPARLLSMIDDESRGDGKIQVAEALGFGKAHRHHRYGR